MAPAEATIQVEVVYCPAPGRCERDGDKRAARRPVRDLQLVEPRGELRRQRREHLGVDDDAQGGQPGVQEKQSTDTQGTCTH